MMDLWTLFVDNVFGGFWMAVIGLIFAQALILFVGRVSAYSVGIFIGLFLLAMALGFGQMIITIPIVIAIGWWTYSQIDKASE